MEVARDPKMGSRVHAVRGNFIFNHRLGLEAQVVLCGHADFRIGRQHQDACMVIADSEFILGADHAEGFHAPDLRLLDLEAAREDGADPGEKDLLACRYVWSSADHGQRLGSPVIHRRDVQMIGIRMGFAGKYFSDHHSGQSAGNFLLLLHGIHLNADRRHRICDLSGAEIGFQIILEPIVRKFHVCK